MFDLLFSLAGTVLRLANLALLVYCVMSFIMPQSDLYRRLASVVEPVMRPVRYQLYRWIPALRTMPVDFSPLAVWLLLDVAGWVLNVLRRIL